MAGRTRLLYTAGGPLAAILLGAALIPLRGLTPASNLAFVFMALTIVVAALGGSGAGLATAAASALSLDFFLTQPYLRLSIEDKHDVIAFAGLAVCGFIAAALAAHRERRIATLSASATHRDLLHAVLRNGDGDEGATIEARLGRALEALPRACPVAAAVIRDVHDQVVASRDPADGLRPVPQQLLDPDSLLPASGAARAPAPWDAVLPAEGGRIALSTGAGRIGWLDVWGDGRPATAASRLALSDLARVIALLLAREGGTASGGRA
jgi:hypothetical protein